MQFSTEQLKIASVNGEKRATEALTVLARNPVKVKTNEVKDIPINDADTVLGPQEGETVLAYTQAVSGIFGLSILSMKRDDGRDLVDTFNQRTPGTTVVMQELDRSTIRETLNILANAYVTELAKLINVPIILDVPHMITSVQLAELIKSMKAKGEKALLIKTELVVENVDFVINLYFFFMQEKET